MVATSGVYSQGYIGIFRGILGEGFRRVLQGPFSPNYWDAKRCSV